MSDASRQLELKHFLRTRREALRPEVLGLARGRRRRTPGLRREEVAAIADVGVTWYTWLEQGRSIKVSRETLQRIARALRLTPTDEDYLMLLADAAPSTEPPATPRPVDPRLQTVMDALHGVPAAVLGPWLDVLAFNVLAHEVFDFEVGSGPFANNHAWRMFMDPKRRALYADDWEELALRTVGVLRARHPRYMGHAPFDGLLAALRGSSPEFVRLWESGRTANLENMTLRLRHPRWGNLKLGLVRFLLPTEPDVFVSTLPPADEKTAALFARVAEGRAKTAASGVRRAAKKR